MGTTPFFFALFFSAFFAQKSHVKPPNHLNLTNKTRSNLKISYLQTAIMNIEIKKEASPPGIGTTPQELTLLERGI
jgi:hypothetical protein